MTLYSQWNSPGQNTGVGSLSLLQGIFPTQGSNSGLLHYRQILNQLSYKGCPRILEWVAYPFSRGSSQPRNRTRVPCIAGGFFTNWVIRKALNAGVGCHLLLPGDLPNPGVELGSPALQADFLPLSHQESPIHILWPSALTPRYTSNYNIYQQLPNKYTRILRVCAIPNSPQNKTTSCPSK